MSGLGVLAIGYGLLNRQSRFRSGRARAWFVVLGAVFLISAWHRPLLHRFTELDRSTGRGLHGCFSHRPQPDIAGPFI